MLSVTFPFYLGGRALATRVSRDVERLLAGLRDLPPPVAKPVLVVVAGLPGTGKSYFSRELMQKVPLAWLESDHLRQLLFPVSSHSAEESGRLFNACHQLIQHLLEKGVPVLFDATNLVEAHREHLYHIADGLGVRLILVFLQAPPEVVYQRLQKRAEVPEPESHSTAGWEVYQRMRTSLEGIRRRHYVVDTSQDISPAIDRIVREIKNAMRTAK